MRNLEKLDYLEMARTVNQLCKTVEELANFLVEKKITTKFDIDCVIENAVLQADTEFDKEIFGIEYEE